MGAIIVVFYRGDEGVPVLEWLEKLPDRAYARGTKMKRTTDAVEILKKRTERNPRLKAMVEEERVNYQAALAIRDARKRVGLTQSRLAKEIGTTQSVIARLEDATYRGHTLKMLEHIAEALGRRVEIKFKPMSEHRPYAYAR